MALAIKKYIPTLNRRMVILFLTQAFSGATIPVLFLVSGLLGPKLAPNLKISTLPMSLTVVGVAIGSPLASWMMSLLGRRRGHLVGLIATQLGVALAGLSLWQSHFMGFSLGCLLSGLGSSFNNQIRFSAAEGAGEQKALVHSWVLMCSLFAALLGPAFVEYGKDLFPAAYLGSLLFLFASLFLVSFVMLGLPEMAKSEELVEKTKKESKVILQDLRFWLACLTGITAFATMTLIMSATPLQTHEVEHFSSSETTDIIRSHIVAMFLPSLFSGVLLAMIGAQRLVVLGVGLFLSCIGVSYFHSGFHHYWWALVLLGVGWNFLFLASSAWISLSFHGSERFFAQGANDALVYGTQALASLAAGWLLFEVGWQKLLLLPVPLLLALLVFLWFQRQTS